MGSCPRGGANAWWKDVIGSYLFSQSGYVKSQHEYLSLLNVKNISLVTSVINVHRNLKFLGTH